MVQLIEAKEFALIGRTPQAAPICAVEAISALAGVDPSRARELLQLGAAYVGEDIKGQAKMVWRRLQWPLPRTHDQTPSYGNFDEPHSEDGPPLLPPHTQLRCHPHPKRFPACSSTNWQARVLHQDMDLLVLNKPAGLPCMAHESNAAEHVAACAARALDLLPPQNELEVGHRLDMWTTGVLVCTLSKAANRSFKMALQDKEQVTKVYKALTWRAAPLGRLRHWMYDGPFNEGARGLLGGAGSLPPRGPRLLSEHPHPSWRMCELEVTRCDKLSQSSHPSVAAWLKSQQLTSHQEDGPITHDTGKKEKALPAASSDGVVAEKESTVLPAGGSEDVVTTEVSEVYEVTVRLLTGRTHQIRAQLAAVGCALVGDVMYGSIQGVVVGQEGVIRDPELAARVQTLPVLSGGLGLHAWHMAWGHHEFCAPAPWHDEAT